VHIKRQLLGWLNLPAPGIFTGRHITQYRKKGHSVDGSRPTPVWSRSEAPVVGQSPPEVQALCRHCLQILTAVTINILNICTIHLLILDQCVSRWRLSDIWGRRQCIQTVLRRLTSIPVSEAPGTFIGGEGSWGETSPSGTKGRESGRRKYLA